MAAVARVLLLMSTLNTTTGQPCRPARVCIVRQKGADLHLSPTKFSAPKYTSSTAGRRSDSLPLLFGDRGQWEALRVGVQVVCHSILGIIYNH